jgi:hypothetical protein
MMPKYVEKALDKYRRGRLKEDGSQTLTRPNGTFMIMRDGKIVSFGSNAR